MSGIGALAQVTTTSADTSVNGGLLLAWLVASYLLTVLPLWFIFKKAGQPEWAALIPIFNIYVMLKVVGRPGWWLLLFLIPFVGLIIWIIVAYDLARSFGHGAGFTIGLILLSWIFLMILAFGGSTYRGPAASQPPGAHA